MYLSSWTSICTELQVLFGAPSCIFGSFKRIAPILLYVDLSVQRAFRTDAVTAGCVPLLMLLFIAFLPGWVKMHPRCSCFVLAFLAGLKWVGSLLSHTARARIRENVHCPSSAMVHAVPVMRNRVRRTPYFRTSTVSLDMRWTPCPFKFLHGARLESVKVMEFPRGTI